jgi:outer membrane receptor protein involved in Fe transport
VTARGVEEFPQQVPISIATLTSEDLDQLGAKTMSDIARAVPNFTVAPTGPLGISQPAIRGVFSPAGAATVGVYLDEVPIQVRSIGFVGNSDVKLFDLERVEVLRGPQGTLFGASAMGGVVRFISRTPDVDRIDGQLGVELTQIKGGDLNREVQAAFGTPIVKGQVGFRAAIFYRHDGGYIDRVDHQTGSPIAQNINDAETFAFRAGLKLMVGETGEILPALGYQNLRRGDVPFYYSSLGQFRQDAVLSQPGHDRFWLPSLTAKFEIGSVKLTSVTAYFDRHDHQVTDYSTVFGELVLGAAIPGLVPEGGSQSRTDTHQQGFTQEIRLQSAPSSRVQWTLGGYYRNARVAFTQNVVEPGIEDLSLQYLGVSVEQILGAPLLPGGISYHGIENVREVQLAGFGEASWHLNRKLELSAGARVSRSRLNLEVLSEGPYAGGQLEGSGPLIQRETPLTPHFSVSFTPAPDRMLFASVGKGFRIGGANTPVPPGPCADDLHALGRTEAPAAFSSDTVWNYEVGAKAAFPRQNLSLGLSLFQINWNGIQQPITLPTCGFSYIDNLGAARNRGFEFEGKIWPVAGLMFSADVGFVDARFRRTISVGGSDQVIVASGDRVPFVPRWSARVASSYERKIRRDLRLKFHAEYQLASSYRRAPSEQAVEYDPRVFHGDSVGNLLARISIEDSNWEVSIFAENLLDEHPILFSNAELVPISGSPLRQMTLAPRTVGVEATLRY